MSIKAGAGAIGGGFLGVIVGGMVGGFSGIATDKENTFGGQRERDRTDKAALIGAVIGGVLGAALFAVIASPPDPNTTGTLVAKTGTGALPPHVCPIPSSTGIPPVVSQLQSTPYNYNSTLNTYYLDSTFGWGASILYKNGLADSVYNMPSRDAAMKAIRDLADAAFAKELSQGG